MLISIMQSNIMNKLDPTVDSDLDGRRNLGNSRPVNGGGVTTSTMGGGMGGGISNSRTGGGIGGGISNSTNAGPHNVRMTINTFSL
jgi:hypothetical protein